MGAHPVENNSFLLWIFLFLENILHRYEIVLEVFIEPPCRSSYEAPLSQDAIIFQFCSLKWLTVICSRQCCSNRRDIIVTLVQRLTANELCYPKIELPLLTCAEMRQLFCYCNPEINSGQRLSRPSLWLNSLGCECIDIIDLLYKVYLCTRQHNNLVQQFDS